MRDIPRSRFTEFIVRENGLDKRGFRAWVFLPGMLFEETDKWWDGPGARTTPHEGTDFCLFAGKGEGLFQVEAGMVVPAMYGGRVVALIDDFLGKTAVLEHCRPYADDPFVTVYGHIAQGKALRHGAVVKEGEVIGLIAGPNTKAKVRPHLHVSLACPQKGVSYEGLTWPDLVDPGCFTLLDPLAVIEGP